jgi:glycosyltransferase involved in cell wall biosynthesis
MKIKMAWARPDDNKAYGNVLGYATHNNMLRKYAEPYFDFDPDAKLVFHLTPADHFRPIAGKTNILFSMWEFDELPVSYIRNLPQADMLIVPSSYCRDVFKKYYHKEVSVCWEGIEPEMYPFKEHTFPKEGERFRILWLGAPNPRKGYHLVQELIKAIQPFKNVEIYIKTTMKKTTWKFALKYFMKNWRRICLDNGKFIGFKRALLRTPTPNTYNSCKAYGENKNVIFDTRRLPYEEMKQLYYSSHLFIFPTLGEGWGLPLGEAMATGLPCVASGYTGCADFFDDSVGYTLKYNTFTDSLPNYDNLVVPIRVPDTKDFLEKVIYVIGHYGEALKKAKKGSERMHNKLTWAQAGKRLYDLIKKEYPDAN